MLALSFLRFLPTPILARQDFSGRVAWWVGGWVRKAEDKAKAQHSWGLAELGNMDQRKIYLVMDSVDMISDNE